VETEEVKAPAPQAPEPKKEKLVTVVALEPFIDGNLREPFEKYGYETGWRSGEKRTIPLWLIKRVLNSGGKLLADNGSEDGRELSLE